MRLELNPRAMCYNLYCDTKEERDKMKQMLEKPLTATDVKSIDNMIYTDTDSIKAMKTKLNSVYGSMCMTIHERRNNMELKDTVEMMCSDDYKDRMKAEYWQNKIRYQKLHNFIVKYEAGTLNFEPSCSLALLKSQASNMGQYLYALEVRAEIEHIEL